LKDVETFLNSNPQLVRSFSPRDILLANASGSLLLLKDLVELKKSHFEDEDSLYFLLKKQQVFNRLLLASTEVAGLAAELDCESERSKQMAVYLDQINDSKTQQLTIASVITGAATGIGTAIFQKTKPQVAIGVSGSIISAIFGGWAAISSRDKVLFMHERNLLQDVWFASGQSLAYPPFIWYMLNIKESNIGDKTTLEALKELWIDEGLFDLDNQKQIELLFSKGGYYRSNELHSRTSMLNQLKAEIRSINQDLQSLMLKLTV
jgi:hypothetical protein